ncbi:NYN domain limkain-b1-type [Arabidopsis suecica]|nr:NYN domain limkain-b1-type [Arabidopsis suecica]
MMMDPPPTKEFALAPVYVYWDMKRCPVPDDYDARRVGPCIKRILRKSGYNGPVTITAVGSLSKVPRDILEVVSSPGISLYHEVATTLMFISRPPLWIPPGFYSNILIQREKKYNSIFPFPLESPREASSTLWKNFLLADPGPLEEEEDSCSETPGPASWICSVCRRICGPGIAGQGVDNFITHLSTREHELKRQRFTNPKGEPPLDSCPENATRGGNQS